VSEDIEMRKQTIAWKASVTKRERCLLALKDYYKLVIKKMQIEPDTVFERPVFPTKPF
jgi:hypothetical protein